MRHDQVLIHRVRFHVKNPTMGFLQYEGAAAEDGRKPSIFDTFTHSNGLFHYISPFIESFVFCTVSYFTFWILKAKTRSEQLFVFQLCCQGLGMEVMEMWLLINTIATRYHQFVNLRTIDVTSINPYRLKLWVHIESQYCFFKTWINS